MTTYMLSYVSHAGLDWEARFTMASDATASEYVRKILTHDVQSHQTYRLWVLDETGAPIALVRKFSVGPRGHVSESNI